MIQKDDKRQIWSWAMYDFANSAFTTVVVTFIYGTFFTKSIAYNEILGTQYCRFIDVSFFKGKMSGSKKEKLA